MSLIRSEIVRPHVENNFLDFFDVDDTPINRLIHGENSLVLRELLKDYGGKVDLVYIDPPFMTGRNFGEFQDRWDRGKYLGDLEYRLHSLRGLLASTGSIYVHLDDHASHYVKIAMDNIFGHGHGSFVNEIVWQRHSAHNDASRFGRIADRILLYAADEKKRYWNSISAGWSAKQVDRCECDGNGWYQSYDLTAPGSSSTRSFEWRGAKPKQDRQWRFCVEEMEGMLAAGQILLKKDGTPRLDGHKVYLHEAEPPPLQDIWTDIALGPGANERLDYPTQKPVELLDRIIRSSCPPGGLVLDCYLGSGTTAEAAERLGCRWIGIDCNERAIQLTKERLVKLHHAPKPLRIEKTYSICNGCLRIVEKLSAHETGQLYKVKPFSVEKHIFTI